MTTRHGRSTTLSLPIALGSPGQALRPGPDLRVKTGPVVESRARLRAFLAHKEISRPTELPARAGKEPARS